MQAMADDDLQTIINVASTAELFATTHYLAAINGASRSGSGRCAGRLHEGGFLWPSRITSNCSSRSARRRSPPNSTSRTTCSATCGLSPRPPKSRRPLSSARIWRRSASSRKSADTTPYAVTCAQIAAVEQTHLALIRADRQEAGEQHVVCAVHALQRVERRAGASAVPRR